MTYVKTAPAAAGSLLTENSKVAQNWVELDTALSVDHYGMGIATNEGKHKQITLIEISDPSPAADEGMLYTKDSGTEPELYYRGESAGDITQLTRNGAPANPVAWGIVSTAAWIDSHNIDEAASSYAGNTWTIYLKDVAMADKTKIVVIPALYIIPGQTYTTMGLMYATVGSDVDVFAIKCTATTTSTLTISFAVFGTTA